MQQKAPRHHSDEAKKLKISKCNIFLTFLTKEDQWVNLSLINYRVIIINVNLIHAYLNSCLCNIRCFIFQPHSLYCDILLDQISREKMSVFYLIIWHQKSLDMVNMLIVCIMAEPCLLCPWHWERVFIECNTCNPVRPLRRPWFFRGHLESHMKQELPVFIVQ